MIPKSQPPRTGIKLLGIDVEKLRVDHWERKFDHAVQPLVAGLFPLCAGQWNQHFCTNLVVDNTDQWQPEHNSLSKAYTLQNPRVGHDGSENLLNVLMATSVHHISQQVAFSLLVDFPTVNQSFKRRSEYRPALRHTTLDPGTLPTETLASWLRSGNEPLESTRDSASLAESLAIISICGVIPLAVPSALFLADRVLRGSQVVAMMSCKCASAADVGTRFSIQSDVSHRHSSR